MELVSNIKFPTKKLIEIAQFVAPPKSKMPKNWTLEFSNCDFNYLDDNVTRIYDKTVEWNGTAYGPPIWLAKVVFRDDAGDGWFPMTWWPNPALPGVYIRGTYLENKEEFLVYMAAHESMHLYAWKRDELNLKRKIKEKRFYNSFGIDDDEFEAEYYAISVLTKWRNKKL